MAKKDEEYPEYKVVVIGAGGSGKSCLTNMFLSGLFTEEYDPTIEDSYTKQMNIDEEDLVLDILDTAGQEEYSDMQDTYMRTGQGFIIVYSVTSMTSFRDVNKFKEKLWLVKDKGPNEKIPIMLVGNKCDLVDQRQVSTKEGEELAKYYGCPFLETSAKSNLNVQETFQAVVREMRYHRKVYGGEVKKTRSPGRDMAEKLKKKFAKWGKLKESFLRLFGIGKDKDKDKEKEKEKEKEDKKDKEEKKEEKKETKPQPASSNPPSQQIQRTGSTLNTTTKITPAPTNQTSTPTSPPTSNSTLSNPLFGTQEFTPSNFDSLCPWFYPTLTSAEAEEMLKGKSAGSFVMRFSSQSGFIATSYVDANGVSIQRGLVGYDMSSFWASEEPKERYPTLQAFLGARSKVLKIPLSKANAANPMVGVNYGKIPKNL